MNILISACLLGVNCKYNGKNNINKSALKLLENRNLIPVCPEQLGGLQTPRKPSERKGGCVVMEDGTDVTSEYDKGAKETLKIAKIYKCRYAVFKEGSPSCGSKKIYDGTFSKVKIEGEGVTAQRLRENGIMVINELDIKKYLYN